MAKDPTNFKEERTFGDMIGAPFQFVFQEFKSLFLATLKYAGPFLLFALIFLIVIIRNSNVFFASENTMMGIIFIAAIFFGMGILAMISTTYSYISAYVTFGKGNFTIKDVGILLKRHILKIFGGGFLLGVMMLPLLLLAAIPVIGVFIFYGLMFYLYVSMSMFAIIAVHEDVNVGKAFSRSFELIKGKWWFTFGLYIVFFLIILFSSYIVMVPLYIGVFASAFSVEFNSVGIMILITVSAVLYLLLYFFIVSLQHSLFSFQYFKLKEKKEGPDLFDKILEINGTIEDTAKPDIFEVKEKEEKDDEQNRFTDNDEIDRFKPKY